MSDRACHHYVLDVSAVGHEAVLRVEHLHGDEPQGLPDLHGFDRHSDVTARGRKRRRMRRWRRRKRKRRVTCKHT